METTDGSVGLENDGTVARIVLRRPPLNILDVDMIRVLNGVLADLCSQSRVRVLVISAEGRAFSAGVAVEDHFPGKVQGMLGAFHEVFHNLRKFCRPTIAAVQGAALGGGCELACFADFVIASEAATFGVPEIKLGVFPPIAAIHFPHRIGLARTLQLVLSGEALPARDAERIGLVDEVVRAGDLGGAVEAAVSRFRDKSGVALRLAKEAVLAAAGGDFASGLRRAEKLYLEDLMKTDDATEGLKAFLEKRAPVWADR